LKHSFLFSSDIFNFIITSSLLKPAGQKAKRRRTYQLSGQENQNKILYFGQNYPQT